MTNKHKGSTFDSFLEEENLLDDVEAIAIKSPRDGFTAVGQCGCRMLLSPPPVMPATQRTKGHLNTSKNYLEDVVVVDLSADLGTPVWMV